MNPNKNTIIRVNVDTKDKTTVNKGIMSLKINLDHCTKKVVFNSSVLTKNKFVTIIEIEYSSTQYQVPVKIVLVNVLNNLFIIILVREYCHFLLDLIVKEKVQKREIL